MRREVFIHFSILVSFLILISVFKGWLSLSYWLFWFGGVVGSVLPDVDHLIYIYFLGSQELTSQRAVYLIRNKNLAGALKLLFDTRAERTDLVLHSNLFLVVSLILVFWMFTSSGSLIGMGLVLGIVVHLLIDRLQNALYHGPHGNSI